MSTEQLERAIGSTRAVLANVTHQQLDDSTPCASWKVRELVNHIVGGQFFFASAVEGRSPEGGDEDYAAGEFAATFDQGAARCVAAFSADGVMERVLTLPFGQMPGSAFLGIAATDTFVHGWDLARATGQSSDLEPDLAAAMLEGVRSSIPESFRGPEGAPFGPEQPAPADATNADRLAAFLGRTV